MTKDFMKKFPKEDTRINGYFCDCIKTNTLKGKATVNYLVEHEIVSKQKVEVRN